MVALGNTCSRLLSCVAALCFVVDTTVMLYVFAALCRADCRLFFGACGT